MKFNDIEIPPEKLLEYCLNSEHPEGCHKARIFKVALGIEKHTSEKLVELLHESVHLGNAEFQFDDKFGKYYHIDYQVQGLHQKEILRSLWIVPHVQTKARLFSCYVKSRKEKR
ncbi:MAG: hypothetical protein HYZ34_09225 [Ignavibacteriae bacterium]|nr:hypothetical protein [Ignavibacteriota bacterium]